MLLCKASNSFCKAAVRETAASICNPLEATCSCKEFSCSHRKRIPVSSCLGVAGGGSWEPGATGGGVWRHGGAWLAAVAAVQNGQLGLVAGRLVEASCGPPETVGNGKPPLGVGTVWLNPCCGTVPRVGGQMGVAGVGIVWPAPTCTPVEAPLPHVGNTMGRGGRPPNIGVAVLCAKRVPELPPLPIAGSPLQPIESAGGGGNGWVAFHPPPGVGSSLMTMGI